MLHLADAIGREPKRLKRWNCHPGMPASEVAALVDLFLKIFPCRWRNNHQGSQATADAALMD